MLTNAQFWVDLGEQLKCSLHALGPVLLRCETYLPGLEVPCICHGEAYQAIESPEGSCLDLIMTEKKVSSLCHCFVCSFEVVVGLSQTGVVVHRCASLQCSSTQARREYKVTQKM